MSHLDYLVQSTGYSREELEKIDKICQEVQAISGGYAPSVEDILNLMVQLDMDRPMIDLGAIVTPNEVKR